MVMDDVGSEISDGIAGSTVVPFKTMQNIQRENESLDLIFTS